jgi:hypothetical protein
MPTIASLIWNWAVIPTTHGAPDALPTKPSHAPAAAPFSGYLKRHSKARECRNAARPRLAHRTHQPRRRQGRFFGLVSLTSGAFATGKGRPSTSKVCLRRALFTTGPGPCDVLRMGVGPARKAGHAAVLVSDDAQGVARRNSHYCQKCHVTSECFGATHNMVLQVASDAGITQRRDPR